MGVKGVLRPLLVDEDGMHSCQWGLGTLFFTFPAVLFCVHLLEERTSIL